MTRVCVMCLMDLILFFGIWEHKLKKVYDRNTHVIRSLVGYLLDTQFCPALGPPQCPFRIAFIYIYIEGVCEPWPGFMKTPDGT